MSLFNKKKNEDSLDENIEKMVENLLRDDEPEFSSTNIKEEQERIGGPPQILINGVSFNRINSMPIKESYNFGGKANNNLGLNLNSMPNDNINVMKMRKMNKVKVVNNELNNELDSFPIGYNNNIINNVLSNSKNFNVGGMCNMGNIGINNINMNNINNIPNNKNFRIISPRNNGGINFGVNNNIPNNPNMFISNDLFSSSNSTGDLNLNLNIPIKTRPKRHIDEGTITVSHFTDMDEILENRVKLLEKVDEECMPFFRGNFLNLIKSQNGSRILQRALNKTSSEILSVIFEETKMFIPELMVDSYANYFCQRFYDFLELYQKLEFLNIMKNNVVNIGNSTIGTYPLQAIIDQMKTREERKIMIESVNNYILDMCQHAQGTHVIEKMILCFEEDSIRNIYEIVLFNFMFLACHCNGLCVTKKVISCSRNQAYIETIQRLLLENGKTLVQNQHGNYSIQVALECWDYKLIHPLIILFHDQFFSLSTQKFSSNVVEKCLERGGEVVLSKFLDEICHKTKIVELIKSPYGNYVIQKALKLASGYHKGKLTGIIKKHLEKLHDKKLISKWKTILGNICGNTLLLTQPRGNKIHFNNNGGMNSSNDSNFSNNSSNNSRESHSPNSYRSNNSNHSNQSYSSVNSSHSFNAPSFNMNNFVPMNMNMNMINVSNNNNQFYIPTIQKGFRSENNSPQNSQMHSPNSSPFFKYRKSWDN